VTTLTNRCVLGIEADRERCRELVENSIGLVTALGPTLGYETTSRIAKRALTEKRKVSEIVLEENLLTHEQLEGLLRIEAMTAPSRASPMQGVAPAGLEAKRQVP
jgi:aspartate ammonia-lyase